MWYVCMYMYVCVVRTTVEVVSIHVCILDGGTLTIGGEREGLIGSGLIA